MAHIGKAGPYVFRRDFNLNVDNNALGWARRCIVHWGAFPTGPAGIWSNSTWDCGPDVFLAPDSLTFDSERVLKFGVHWFSQFSVQITARDEYRRRIRLITVEFGTILEITYGLRRDPRYGPQSFEGRAITVWDPDFFDQFPGGALESTFRPKLWSDGPPH